MNDSLVKPAPLGAVPAEHGLESKAARAIRRAIVEGNLDPLVPCVQAERSGKAGALRGGAVTLFALGGLKF